MILGHQKCCTTAIGLLICVLNVVLLLVCSQYRYQKFNIMWRKPTTPTLPGLPPRIDILYLVKSCGRFQKRAKFLYESWGWRAENIVFSTDKILNSSSIPPEKQRIQSLPPSLLGSMASLGKDTRHSAESCVVSLLNFAGILQEIHFQGASWLMIVDDDTFVLEKNLLTYLRNFSSLDKYYLGLSNAEKLDWRTTRNGTWLTIAATASGILFSKGLLDDMRERHRTLFTVDAVYKHCVDARYGDDVALGILAQVHVNASLIARPDLRGFHWHTERSPTNIQPLTIHTEQQFVGGRVKEMHTLGMKYFGSLKTG